jgi:hypothetical protein
VVEEARRFARLVLGRDRGGAVLKGCARPLPGGGAYSPNPMIRMKKIGLGPPAESAGGAGRMNIF